MTRPNVQSLEYYRHVVALGLAETHACPPGVVAALMDDYGEALHGCWAIGAAAIVPIKLLYAEWKTFRAV
ncbi:hypothetical protein QZM89_33165 [Burkholderia gladioli]|uniref:hypothetical protein n=1 Tax=Burkholderia gladioli TaxID=28095 RepID=UPI00264EBDBE|nr:hypothetical protein [Burkholderia gladioli]MDN7500050.1 hypothetical protein [Burkholderia gladioli]